MSGYEKIKERILDDARLTAKIGIERAEGEAAIIIKNAQKEAIDSKNQIITKAKNEALEVRKRMIAIAELEIRKQKLRERHEIIEHVFEEALNKLCSLPDSSYQQILVDMIVNAVETGNEEVVLSERDKARLNTDFIVSINNKLKDKGIQSDIKLSDNSANIRGGFILKIGNVEMNSSFETLIRMKRDILESEIFTYLF